MIDMNKPKDAPITEADLVGKKLEDMTFWGQDLWLNIYYFLPDEKIVDNEIGDYETMLKELQAIYDEGNSRWSFSGNKWGGTLTLYWQPTAMSQAVKFEGVMRELIVGRRHHFGLGSSSCYCRQVAGDGITFELDKDGIICKVISCEPGG